MAIMRYIKVDANGLYQKDIFASSGDTHDTDGDAILEATHVLVPGGYKLEGFAWPKWDGAAWIEGGIIDIEGVRDTYRRAVADRVSTIMAEGFVFSQFTIRSLQSDREATLIQGLRLASGRLLHPDFRFITTDGAVFQPNAVQFVSVMAALEDRSIAVSKRSYQLIEAITAAASIADLRKINVADGTIDGAGKWPAV